MTVIDESKIKDRIFRHANVVFSSRYDSQDDCVFVKEKLVMEDGSIVDNLRPIENYERKFWVTKERFRNHKQKKEREMMDKLQEYRSTQRLLPENAKRALGNHYLGNTLREVGNSPYLYGTDIDVESIVADEYEKNRTTDTDLLYEYGAYDIETYVSDQQFMNDPNMASLVTNNVIQTTVHRHFVRQFGEEKARELITNLLYKELGDDIKALGLTFELEFVDDPGMVSRRSIERIHETSCDIVGIWNIDFDIPRTLDTLLKYGHSPEDVFSDPGVPRHYKYFRYVQGPKVRMTDAGKALPLAPAEQWHYAIYPAKWNLVDSMCVYADLRKAGGKEPYGLDPVLKKNLKGRGKLKFNKADHLKNLEWHVFMQENYPIEYIIYNIFDCLGMILLDNQIKDMCVNFPLLIGKSHISKAMSNPKKFCTDVFFRLLEKEEPSVLGSTGRKEAMILEIDEKLPDKRGWIMTLSADMSERAGINIFSDVPDLPSNVFIHNSDLDIEGTYPNEQVAYNVSKETTRYEVISIDGVGWEQRRRWGVLMNAGEVNCMQLAKDLFKFPTMDALLEDFEKEINSET